jgi:peptidoglycan/LPS O-acetylase OafA/YrhL
MFRRSRTKLITSGISTLAEACGSSCYYGFMVLVLIVLPRFINPYWLAVETPNGGVVPFFLYYTNYAEVFIGWAPASLGVLWSLAIEEHFYLFWPTFIKLTPKNKLLYWCVLVALVALMSRLAIQVFKVTWLAAYLTTSRLDSLVMGAIIAILVRRHPDWPKRWAVRVGGAMAIILLAIAVWRHGLIFNDWPMRTFGYSLLAVLFASVVWLAGNTTGLLSRVLAHPILVMFGNYSYCIYVCHMLVLRVCERGLGPRFFPALGWSGDAPLPLFVISLAGSLAVASLSWHFYERPFLSLKVRFAST